MSWGKSILGEETSLGKGPEAEKSLVRLWNGACEEGEIKTDKVGRNLNLT